MIIFSYFRSIPEEELLSLVQIIALMTDLPLRTDFDPQDAIAFFDTQRKLLRSPEWADTLRKYEPFRQAITG